MIATSAFRNNKDITTINISSGLKIIGNSAFTGCTGLTDATTNPTVKVTSADATNPTVAYTGTTNKKATIKVPKKQMKTYKKLFTSKTGYKKTMKIKK